MATTTTPNTFESRLGGVTLRGQAHSLSTWFVIALRLSIGIVFLNAGISKLTEGGFDATGYLMGTAGRSPLAELFTGMATTPWLMDLINVLVPYGQVAIGLGLIVGGLLRLAAFFGAFMMAMFYFANWDMAHGFMNSDLVYLIVFLAVAAFGAGRILGVDAIIEKMDVGGKALIERYPKLRYVLG
jgi:thiosulfate dehydrogenase [quinone] large subunit